MKYILQLLYWAIIVTIIALWWNYNSYAFTPPTAIGAIYALGKLGGLLGLTFMALQLPLAARFPFIERWFGQDRIMRFHRITGIVGVCLVLGFHFVLFDISYLLVSKEALISFLLDTTFPKLVGMVGAGLLGVIFIVSLWRARLHIPYHWFKRLHVLMYVVVTGGFTHSLLLGSDLLAPGVLRYMWYGLAGLAAVSFLYRWVVTPMLAHRRAYHVKSIREEAHDVHTITFEKNPKHSFIYKPGQFLFVKFVSSTVSGEWHPFTISSSPTEQQLSITPKALGDWTSTLTQLMPGDTAYIQAPFGRFSYVQQTPQAKSIVLIAGGIGITPFRSMLRYVADTNSTVNVQLLYGNKSRQDIAFHTELDKIANEHTNIHVTHVLSDDATWAGETGRIDATCITKLIKDLPMHEYFVCGPPPMMKAVLRTLRDLDVPAKQIHSEQFSLT